MELSMRRDWEEASLNLDLDLDLDLEGGLWGCGF